MSSAWICNASPLIVLSHIERLDLLDALPTPVCVPATVLAEIEAGRTGDAARAQVRAQPLIRIVDDVPVPDRIGRWQLDPGEAQVLAQALARPESGAILDDRAGRRCGRSLGVPLIGTIGLVALARRRGRIAAATPVFRSLIEAGLYVAPGLLRAVLTELGEGAPH